MIEHTTKVSSPNSMQLITLHGLRQVHRESLCWCARWSKESISLLITTSTGKHVDTQAYQVKVYMRDGEESMYVHLIQFVCSFAILNFGQKLLHRSNATKLSGIIMQGSRSVLHGLKSPVLQFFKRYPSISGFSFTADGHFDFRFSGGLIRCRPTIKFQFTCSFPGLPPELQIVVGAISHVVRLPDTCPILVYNCQCVHACAFYVHWYLCVCVCVEVCTIWVRTYVPACASMYVHWYLCVCVCVCVEVCTIWVRTYVPVCACMCFYVRTLVPVCVCVCVCGGMYYLGTITAVLSVMARICLVPNLGVLLYGAKSG